MNLSRLDLDGVGSPLAIASRIHELAPSMPLAVPIEQLCGQLDIGSITQIETSAFEAALVMDEFKARGSILLAANRMPERQRYSLGHELGHFLIPSHRPSVDHPFQCSLADFHLLDERDRDRHRRVEAEANRFAAHLLMPPARVRQLIRQTASSLESIVAMAHEFKVSKEAMARAWVDANRNPTAVVVLHNRHIQRCYRAEDFPWIVGMKGERVSAVSVAASSHQSGTYSEIEEVDPETWLCERDAKRTLELTEQVLFQRDGYALVLLQIEFDDN